jgi:hypothetical protein
MGFPNENLPEFDGGEGGDLITRYLETGSFRQIALSSTQEVGAGGVASPPTPRNILERTGGSSERIVELRLLSGGFRVSPSDYHA